MVQVSWADLDEEAAEALMFLREINICVIVCQCHCCFS